MRRLIFVMTFGCILALATGMPAGAAKGSSPIPAEVQGTYSYRDAGYKITVGYICPGYVGYWGADIYANYYAYVSGTKGGTGLTRHAPWKLDVSLQQYFGAHLSEQAYAVLRNDAATIQCS